MRDQGDICVRNVQKHLHRRGLVLLQGHGPARLAVVVVAVLVGLDKWTVQHAVKDGRDPGQCARTDEEVGMQPGGIACSGFASANLEREITSAIHLNKVAAHSESCKEYVEDCVSMSISLSSVN